MKKWTALLIALVMLMSAGTVLAETRGTPDLYDLYDADGNGRTWIGTAVPILDGVAITSPVGLPEKVTALEIWDGTAYRPVSLALPVTDGKVLVLLHETDGEEPAIPAYDYLLNGFLPQPGELIVRSGDRMRSRINRAVYDTASITWNNLDALLVTLSGDTVPGAPLITTDGKLAGMVTAEYGEGNHRYVVITLQEITRSLQEAANLLDEPETDNRAEGYTVTVEGNLVTFDWSGVKLPETAEGEKLYHIVADYDSSYLTYVEVSAEDRSITMLLTPGRTYISGLGVYTDDPSELPEQKALTVLPEAEPMTDNEFRSIVFAIAELPEDAPQGTMPTAGIEITEELLRSGRACVYSVSSYKVEEMTENYTLLITLTAPDGNNYRHESGWYYDPTIMEKDEWYENLSDTGLLEMLNRNGYPEGTYELAMYIDGKLADRFSFELTK